LDDANIYCFIYQHFRDSPRCLFCNLRKPGKLNAICKVAKARQNGELILMKK